MSDYLTGSPKFNVEPTLGFSIKDVNQGIQEAGSLGPMVSLNDSWGNQQTAPGFDFGFGSFNSTPTLGQGQDSGIFSMKSMFGGTDKFGHQTGGWVSPAMGILKSGLGFYMGSQQLDHAKDALAENKRQFNMNYGAQKELINEQLRWKHMVRKNSNPNYNEELTQIG